MIGLIYDIPPCMKYLILSDIHGCLPRLEQALCFFEREHYDMLIILGDILYYGPRNRVPEGMDAPGIVERLNALADRIVAVRGNCDAEVDQMLLRFPIMADYALLVHEGRRIFLTHGHKYSPDSLPFLGIDAMVSGHTHLWQLRRDDKLLVCNTGSITFPKGGNPPTFVTLEANGTFHVRSLDGEVIASLS